MLPSSLDVERGKVEAKVHAGLLEQVVGHLAGHRVVHGLGHLVDEAHDEAVGEAGLEEVVGLLDHLRQPLGGHKLVALGPALNGGWQ